MLRSSSFSDTPNGAEPAGRQSHSVSRSSLNNQIFTAEPQPGASRGSGNIDSDSDEERYKNDTAPNHGGSTSARSVADQQQHGNYATVDATARDGSSAMAPPPPPPSLIPSPFIPPGYPESVMVPPGFVPCYYVPYPVSPDDPQHSQSVSPPPNYYHLIQQDAQAASGVLKDADGNVISRAAAGPSPGPGGGSGAAPSLYPPFYAAQHPNASFLAPPYFYNGTVNGSAGARHYHHHHQHQQAPHHHHHHQPHQQGVRLLDYEHQYYRNQNGGDYVVRSIRAPNESGESVFYYVSNAELRHRRRFAYLSFVMFLLLLAVFIFIFFRLHASVQHYIYQRLND